MPSLHWPSFFLGMGSGIGLVFFATTAVFVGILIRQVRKEEAMLAPRRVNRAQEARA